MRGKAARELRTLAKILMQEEGSTELKYQQVPRGNGKTQVIHDPKSFKGLVNILKQEFRLQKSNGGKTYIGV